MRKKVRGKPYADVKVSSASAGSAGDFRQIVEDYRFPIIRYLYRMTGDYETARDLAQDTFVLAYKNIEKTGSDLKLTAWLYRIATNCALKYHRRKKILSFIPFETAFTPASSGNGHNPDDTTEEIAIRDTLKKIPYDQRNCIVLYYVEGFNYREIGEMIGISEDAVRKRVSRGVQAFRSFYNGGNKK